MELLLTCPSPSHLKTLRLGHLLIHAELDAHVVARTAHNFSVVHSDDISSCLTNLNIRMYMTTIHTHRNTIGSIEASCTHTHAESNTKKLPNGYGVLPVGLDERLSQNGLSQNGYGVEQ